MQDKTDEEREAEAERREFEAWARELAKKLLERELDPEQFFDLPPRQ